MQVCARRLRIGLFTTVTTMVSEAFRRKARRLVVRLAQYVRFYADRYSAAVQYEDLANLSAAELERHGIAPGVLHRHVADALPKWPGASSPDETNCDRHPRDANASSEDFKTWSAGRASKIS